jgi:hypothetical protein
MSKNVSQQVAESMASKAKAGKTPPRPRQVQRKRARGVGDILDSMKDNFLGLERGIAGYNALSSSLQTLTGNLPEGERERGLPIFAFKATTNGRDAIDVCADLKQIPKEYVPYVLGPLIHAQGRQAQSALAALCKDVNDLAKILDRALAAQQEEEQEAPAEEGQTEEQPEEPDEDEEEQDAEQ